MPFERPTLAQLRERIANDFEFRLQAQRADAHTPGTGYTELAQVVAAVAHGLYGNQQWLAAQLFVNGSDDDTVVQKAAERGIPRIAATFASGHVTLTGNDGAAISSEAMLQATDGMQYRTTAAAVIAGGTALVPVIAQQPGAAGNRAAGTSLTFVSTVSGVDSSATIAVPGLTGGADIESIARVRERLLEHLQRPPMGGKSYDYEAWAKAASVDVSRAWAFMHEDGIGSVTVRFVAENLADPIPDSALIDAVEAYIDARRPAGLRSLTVTAPTPKPLDLVFTSLTPNTAEVRAAIEAEVKDLIRRVYQPGGTLLLSQIREAISRAAGETDYVMTLDENVTHTTSEFPTWGVPTWPGA